MKLHVYQLGNCLMFSSWALLLLLTRMRVARLPRMASSSTTLTLATAASIAPPASAPASSPARHTATTPAVSVTRSLGSRSVNNPSARRGSLSSNL